MNSTGTMKRVRKEETIRPKITALPRAIQVPLLSVTGKIPTMVHRDVMTIASRRAAY